MAPQISVAYNKVLFLTFTPQPPGRQRVLLHFILSSEQADGASVWNTASLLKEGIDCETKHLLSLKAFTRKWKTTLMLTFH